MLGRFIFCVAIAAALLAVVLLAAVSPVPHRPTKSAQGRRAITVYIHPAPSSAGAVRQQQPHQGGGAAHEVDSALVFRHRMTSGPAITSRTVGAASGFVLPGERGSATTMSAFDTAHLAFDAPGLSGSLCVEAARGKKQASPREEVLRVVGGTGAFAFASGHAVLSAERPDSGGAGSSALRLELSVTSAG